MNQRKHDPDVRFPISGMGTLQSASHFVLIDGRERAWARSDPGWAIRTALGVSRGEIRSDADLVARVIDFVNGQTDLAPVRYGIRFDMGLEAGWSPPRKNDGTVDQNQAGQQLASLVLESDVSNRIALYQEDARLLLRAALSGTHKLSGWVAAFQEKHGADIGVVRRPVVDLSAPQLRQISWSMEIDPLTPGRPIEKILGYVSALLLADQDRCRSDLGLCHLSECGSFFRIERGKRGKPRTEYCCEEHMLTSHARAAARRQRDYQARKRAKAKQSRRRKGI